MPKVKNMMLHKARSEKGWGKRYRHYWLNTVIYSAGWAFFILMGLWLLFELIGMIVK